MLTLEEDRGIIYTMSSMGGRFALCVGRTAGLEEKYGIYR